jgi:hypothetical protein
MIEKRHLAAVAGFAFVAAWIGFNFGDALLCLLGAAVFWLAAGVFEGKVDLGALQSRLSNEEPPPPPVPPMRRPAGRPRVQ